MHINKVVSADTKKVAQKFTKIAAAATFVTASTLFADSKKEGIDPSVVINEYYENEFQLRKCPFPVHAISRFSSREKFEILQNMEEIRVYPKAFSFLINAKKPDKTQRLNTDEALMIFQEVGAEVEAHTSISKKILYASDKNNQFLYDANSCIILMREIDSLINCPKAFDKMIEQELQANICKLLLVRVGNILENDPTILEQAIKLTEEFKEQANYGRILVKTIEKIDKYNKREMEKLEKQRLAEMKLALKRKQEARALKKDEERKMKQELSIERAKIREAQRMKEKERIRKEVAILEKEAGWVSPEVIFQKINNSKENGTEYVLESGDVLPNEIRDKIYDTISVSPKKAAYLVNMRYSNKKPIFNEKIACDMLSELNSYSCIWNNCALRKISSDGTPFFTPEQCKALLRQNNSLKTQQIERLFNSPNRQYSATDIVKIITTEFQGYKNVAFYRMLNTLDNEGKPLYTVDECIDIIKNDYI